MPELTERDPEALHTSLTAWLRKTLGESADPVITDLHAPTSSGFSNETILLTATWSEDGERSEHRLVLRVHPTRHTLFLDADFTLQYRVMNALQDQPTVPVPTLRWYEDDTETLGVPFFVMDHVDGLIPADNLPYTLEGWLLESSEEDQANLWWNGIDALADIHKLDWKALGLGALADDKYGAPGLERNMNYYRAFLDSASEGRPQPTAEAAWEWLVANQPTPDGDLVLSWGDSRIGNMIWKDFAPAAVLDWEMATVGPPELDLGWWLYFDRQFSEGLGVARPPGFGDHDATIARYEERLGRKVGDLFWYEVFAGFRFAVIMSRLTDLLVSYGQMPEDTDMDTNNLATQFIAQLLGLPSPASLA